jgi:2-octaprenyl-6-methoxyphenol hydroxylase
MSGENIDAVVVGGGLAGLAAAVAVASAGLRTVHLVPKGPPDRRTSALMLPAVEYLQAAGLVPDPASIGQPLTQIRIIDATKRLIRAPETLFDSDEAGLPAFGWNMANVKLAEAFEAAGRVLPGLSVIETTLDDLEAVPGGFLLRLGNGEIVSAGLVVGADGKKSLVREKAGIGVREHGFEQAALVCDLALTRPIGGTSVEFHYENGPFTLVPAGGNRANLVYIDRLETLKAAQAGGPEGLMALFRQKSQGLFGKLELLTPSFVFPLSTLTVDVAGRDGVVLVGESAHAFPPIGAQGLNLGLRDVADLAASLAAVERGAPDFARRVSEDYAGRRAHDLARTGTVVDTLFRSLLADFLPAQVLRAGGLWALKLVPPLRRTAFGIGMGAR